MIILTTDMFKDPGMVNIALDNTKEPELQACIDQWESYYIYQLLSNSTPQYATGLAQQFIADAQAHGGVPTIARFVKIFNSFNEMVGSKMYNSAGMIAVFKALIAYHYITEGTTYSGTGGITSGNSSASKSMEIASQYRWAESRFNWALDSIDSIKWWLQAGNSNGGGSAQYPEYINIIDDVFKPRYQSLL